MGLPLAIHLGRHFKTIGFDINSQRVRQLQAGYDDTREMEGDELSSPNLEYTDDPTTLALCGLIIVAVPTPVDDHKNPDLTPLIAASHTVGTHMSPGTIVVFESTVYPGTSEHVCAPVLEKASTLTCGRDFWIGYSPERINPGDKQHTIEHIVKVVSGQNSDVLDLLADVYGTIVTAGIHKARDIKTAEAAKVIENTQRDLNIALMNELAIIFGRMGIDTLDVLDAAATKWNFLRFTPGLVGGHCIGVDPYYLTYAAEKSGYIPHVILAGRRINDGMGKYVAEQTVKRLIKNGKDLSTSRVVVLGLTFKENVSDLRNTRVVDIIQEFQSYGIETIVHDPLARPDEAQKYCQVELVDDPTGRNAAAVVLAVPHKLTCDRGMAWIASCASQDGLFVDVKGAFSPAAAAAQNLSYWRL